MKLTNLFNKMEEFGKKEAPAILTGMAIAGLIATGYNAYKAGLEAKEIIEEAKKDLEYVKKGDKKAKREIYVDTAKRLVPVVAPMVTSGIFTGSCIFASNKVSSRRIKVLSAAYAASNSAIQELGGKMEEVLGERKTKAIKDAITADKLKKDGVPKDGQIIITGDGDVLCKDDYTGRFFRSSGTKLDQAINELTHQIYGDMYVSLNEFYDKIGLDNVPMGDDFGWNVDDIAGGRLPVTFTALLTDDNRPCLCLTYDVRLRSDYRNLH